MTNPISGRRALDEAPTTTSQLCERCHRRSRANLNGAGGLLRFSRYCRRCAHAIDAERADWQERRPDWRCPDCGADIGDGICQDCGYGRDA